MTLRVWLVVLVLVAAGACVRDVGASNALVPNPPCPNQCSGHGTCQPNGECDCEEDWMVSADCSQHDFVEVRVFGCPSECSGNGRCNNGTCVCDPAWAGPACQHSACPDACSGNGICHRGKCFCQGAWSGPNCSVASDHEHTGDACGEGTCVHGSCVDKQCRCHKWYEGRWCDRIRCVHDCSGHGKCNNGTCACNEGWTGVDCAQSRLTPQQPQPNGEPSPSGKRCAKDCSGHGVCGDDGYCTCVMGWHGLACDEGGCPENCNGFGRCVDGRCQCVGTYTGRACERRRLPPGQFGDEIRGEIHCDENWALPRCDRLACPGYGTDAGECSRRGVCSQGRCHCTMGYEGPSCAEKRMQGHGVRHGDVVVCSPGYTGPDCLTKICEPRCVHGECVDGHCVCDSEHTGKTCAQVACPANCSGHGDCNAGMCDCDTGWEGLSCNSLSCPDDCSNNGVCANGQCICDDMWEGDSCSQRVCVGGCVHGQCNATTGRCDCDEGYFGKDCSCMDDCVMGYCEGGRCVCQDGYAGAACDHQDCAVLCNGHGTCADESASCVCESGWGGKRCTRQCGCTVHGECTADGCVCTPPWEGVLCQLWRLPSGHGHVDPEASRVECDAKWEHPPQLNPDFKQLWDMEQDECVGDVCEALCSAASCPDDCFRSQQHGQCVDGRCECGEGFSGVSCERVHCPDDCAGRGQCDFSNGHCACDPGYLLSNCSVLILPHPAHGKLVFDTAECSPGFEPPDCIRELACPAGCETNGNCVRGVCECKEGFYGVACQHMNESICNGHGTFLGHLDPPCLCEEGWNGTHCEFPVFPALEPKCHPNAGFCPTGYSRDWSPGCQDACGCNADDGAHKDLCDECCLNSGTYEAPDCHTAPPQECPELFSREFLPDCVDQCKCSESGCEVCCMWSAEDAACATMPPWGGDCEAPKAADEEVEEEQEPEEPKFVTQVDPITPDEEPAPDAPGASESTPEAQAAEAEPEPEANAVASPDHENAVAAKDCPGAQPITQTTPCGSDCSGHGECVSEGEGFKCVCDDYWVGELCDDGGRPPLVGKGGALPCPLSCSGHGQCDNGQCVCTEGYGGQGCQYQYTEPTPCFQNCYGNGACQNGNCSCNPGYSAASYCLYPECPNNCSDRGQCVKGKCVCRVGWGGDSCDQKVVQDNNWYHFTFYSNWPKGRVGTQMAASESGEFVYLVGGYSLGYDMEVWRLDTQLVEWTKVDSPGPKPPGREGHSVVRVKHELWMVGGRAFHPPDPPLPMVGDDDEPPVSTENGGSEAEAAALPAGDFKYMNDVWKFDLSTSMWREVVTSGPQPVPRYRASLAVAPDNQTLLYFGGCMFKVQYAALNDLWMLDTAAETPVWSEHPLCKQEEPMADKGDDQGGAEAPSVLIQAGTGQDAGSLGDVDPSSLAADLPAAGGCPEDRYGHSAASWGGNMYIFGGTDGELFYNDIWVFDMLANNETGKWEHLTFDSGIVPEARDSHCGAMDHRGDLYVSMGEGDGRVLFNDMWRYSFESGEWEDMEPKYDERDKGDGFPVARQLSGCVHSKSNIYIYGGEGNTAALGELVYDDLWVYDFDEMQGHTAGSNAIITWSATYGANCNVPMGQHTAYTSALCDNKPACKFKIGTSLVSDPAPNCGKNVEVLYRCGQVKDKTAVPMYRYWIAATKDHVFTTNPSEFGTLIPNVVGKHAGRSEGVAFLLWPAPGENKIPLYRYYHPRAYDHFYTTNEGEIGRGLQPGARGKYGYIFEGIQGYVSTYATSDMVPLYRYWQSQSADHFYTTNVEEIGATAPGQLGIGNYRCEGIMGYVLPAKNFRTASTPAEIRCHLSLAGNPRFKARHPEECTDNTQRLAVRCCGTRGERIPMGRYGCNNGRTFAQAQKLCESHQLRLCTRDEIARCRTCGTGCGYDFQRVWTSSSVADVAPVELDLRCDIEAPPPPSTEVEVGRDTIKRAHVDGASNIQFVYTSATFDEAGKVKTWHFYADRTGDLKLQVWRAQDSGPYMLVGENKLEVTQLGLNKFSPTPFEQILVQPGDAIGWRHQGVGIISFGVGGGDKVRWKYGGPAQVGGEMSFGSGGSRVYSVKAIQIV